MNKMRNQAKEDDDEDFETKGINRQDGVKFNSNNGFSTGGIIGLAALAIGGYAIGKTYFSKEKKLSDTKEEIIQKIKEIQE